MVNSTTLQSSGSLIHEMENAQRRARLEAKIPRNPGLEFAAPCSAGVRLVESVSGLVRLHIATRDFVDPCLVPAALARDRMSCAVDLLRVAASATLAIECLSPKFNSRTRVIVSRSVHLIGPALLSSWLDGREIAGTDVGEPQQSAVRPTPAIRPPNQVSGPRRRASAFGSYWNARSDVSGITVRMPLELLFE